MKDFFNSVMWAIVIVVSIGVGIAFVYYTLEGVRYIVEWLFPNLHWRWVIFITFTSWSFIYVSALIFIAKRLSSNAN